MPRRRYVHVLWVREPHEKHGDRRNIVYADLKKAGDASKISVKDAVRNIERTLPRKNPRMPRLSQSRSSPSD
jgi:prepilin-type processing-associated H-X9-DG protein